MSFPPKATFLPCWLKRSVMTTMACLIRSWMSRCRRCHLQTCRETLSLSLCVLRCISCVFLQMTNPAIQNDFSYYRRTLSRMRINNVPVSTSCPTAIKEYLTLLKWLQSMHLYEQLITWILVCERSCSSWWTHNETSDHKLYIIEHFKPFVLVLQPRSAAVGSEFRKKALKNANCCHH